MKDACNLELPIAEVLTLPLREGAAHSERIQTDRGTLEESDQWHASLCCLRYCSTCPHTTEAQEEEGGSVDELRQNSRLPRLSIGPSGESKDALLAHRKGEEVLTGLKDGVQGLYLNCKQQLHRPQSYNANKTSHWIRAPEDVDWLHDPPSS